MPVRELHHWSSINKLFKKTNTCLEKKLGNTRERHAYEDYKQGLSTYYELADEEGSKGYFRALPCNKSCYIDYINPLDEKTITSIKAWAQSQQIYDEVHVNARHPAVHYTLADHEPVLHQIHLQPRPQVTSDTPRNGKHYISIDVRNTYE